MNGKTKLLAVGVTALVAFGLLMAVNATEGMEKRGRMGFFKRGFGMGQRGGHGNKTALLEDLGLPEDATTEQVRDAVWEKQLADLGLTEDSTIGEFREAMEARRQERHEERLDQVREKLGLTEDATEEEIWEAMKQWREENKGLLSGGGFHPRRGGCPEIGIHQ
jgi:hypothetical protein